MRLRRAILAASLVASPLALALPAQAAGQDTDHSVRIEGFASVEAGGGWSEGAVTVKNDADAPYTGQHLVIYFGSKVLGKDQVAAEYADGASGSWQPVKLVDQDLGVDPAGYQGVATDLTGAGVEVQPHSARTFKLRFKLLQSTHEGPWVSVGLQAFLAPTFGADGQAKNWTVQAPGASAKTTGLTTAFTGLPKSVPADGKPHAFQVSIKTANGFDWHLTSAAFFVWGGQKYGSMSGPAACDAQLDVQDPKDKSWHKVGMAAVGIGDHDVDLAKWATGPVDNRVLNARITLGKNFKTDTDASLGFGNFPGSTEMLFWTKQPIAAAPVEGAPECVDPNAPAPTPSTSSAPAVPASVSTTTPAAPAPVTVADTNRAELADTGSRGLGLTAGIAGALVVAGGAAIVLTRRTRRG
ncbi:hypothetical protein ACFU7Y_23760 [Kitasatospora sp. NPDC057542]|uniref:hypothetical protein n=1 Tax=Streptomycetaceae TaxID=2062 RepID=UPI001CCB49B0|nr:hypothetical protein [Streptomyces sp. LS1784]